MTATTTQATRGSARVALVGVVVAVVAATAIWVVASMLGADLTVSFGGDPIKVTVVSVVGTALLASLVGWGLLAVLRRVTSKALAIWTGVASVAAVLSLLGPLSADATGATKLTLVTMHLAVALVLIGALRRSPRS